MAKRVTISLPDAMEEEIKNAFPKIGVSEVCQRALRAELDQRRQRKEQLTNGGNLEAILQRLRAEKAAYEEKQAQEAINGGYSHGVAFAQQAPYETLIYALNFCARIVWTDINGAEHIEPHKYDALIADKVLGGYLAGVLENVPIEIDENGYLTGATLKWLVRWCKGVFAFWEEVAGKI